MVPQRDIHRKKGNWEQGWDQEEGGSYSREKGAAGIAGLPGRRESQHGLSREAAATEGGLAAKLGGGGGMTHAASSHLRCLS